MEENPGLPVYIGNRSCCDTCGHRFMINEPVMVDEINDLIFCYSDPELEKSCVVNAVMTRNVGIIANTMKYHGNT